MAEQPIDWDEIRRAVKDGDLEFTPDSEKLAQETLKRMLGVQNDEEDRLQET